MGLKHNYGGSGRRSIAETEAAFASCSCEIMAGALLFWQPDFACAFIVLAWPAQLPRPPRSNEPESNMNVGAIDSSRIEAMMAQLKAAAARPAATAVPVAPAGEAGAAKVNFADALKNSIGAVSDAQTKAGELGKAFQMGDDKVALSDVMISMQKASIGFQATLQVRNKLVSAYHEIMNMQV
jgi:flagellar hook-basal body complex protein FliE